MKKFILLLALVQFLAWSAQAKLNVVATTSDFGAIAKEIGGDKIDLLVLARPTEDPHFVDAKPSYIVKLSRADAVIEGGAELEIGWLPPLLEGARNAKLAPGAPGYIACNQGVQLLEIPSTLDRSKGDIHAAGNPHYMADPLNAKIIAQHIAQSFCQIDRKNCNAYQANLQKFSSELEAKVQQWEKALAPYRGRHLVAYHNSWLYFANRFGFKIDLFLEPKPGLPPTPAHLAEVVTRMKQENARVILVDPYLNRKTAETVARNTEATVVDVSQFPGGLKGTEGNYIKLLDTVVTSLAKALASK